MADTGVARLDAKVRQGQEILAQLKPLRHIEGCDKLARKVSAELKFLQKLQRKPHMLKEDHLRSSNMESLQAIADTLSAAEGAMAVLAAFTCPETGERVVVDVVAAGGAEWIKVISRNPAALQRVSLGQGEFGQRSTQEQAERYLAAADGNRHYFRPPTVRFVFSAGVGRRLAERLRARGVTVTGQCIDDDQLGVAADSDSDSNSDSSADELEEEREEMAPLDQEGDNSGERVSATLGSLSPDSGLNLDVTAMLAYVSNLTNGHCHASFSEPVLSQQAAWERETPVKPALDRLFAGRQLVCCRSAERAFVSIVNTVGGPSEQARARLLLQRLQVVEDRTAPATALLAARGKVRGRSAAVFGTGEALRIPTVTANTGFVRAAAGQGVKLTALTHGSRALTEAKEHPPVEGAPAAAAAGGTQPVEDEGSSSSDTSPPSSDVDESVPGSPDAVAPLSQPSPLPVF